MSLDAIPGISPFVVELIQSLLVSAILGFMAVEKCMAHRRHRSNGGHPEHVLSEIRDYARDSNRTADDSLSLQRESHTLLVKQGEGLKSLTNTAAAQAAQCQQHQASVDVGLRRGSSVGPQDAKTKTGTS